MNNTNTNGFIACNSLECECMGRGHKTTSPVKMIKRVRCTGCGQCNGWIECWRDVVETTEQK